MEDDKGLVISTPTELEIERLRLEISHLRNRLGMLERQKLSNLDKPEYGIGHNYERKRLD